MRKIALPEEGIETLYGAHDANLKHIETLLSVAIRTQGSQLTVEGDPAAEQRAARIFDQLVTLMAGGYTLSRNGHVRGDVLYRFLSPRVQASLDLALYLLFYWHISSLIP